MLTTTDHSTPGLAVLAGMLLQASGGGLAAERITVWWYRDGRAQGLASLGAGAVIHVHTAIAPLPCRARAVRRPDAAAGALAGLAIGIRVPIRVGDHEAGFLMLERRGAAPAGPAARSELRRFASQLAHALYRYEREQDLLTLFRDREGVSFSGYCSTAVHLCGYWARGSIDLDADGRVEAADPGAVALFAPAETRGLPGTPLQELVSGVPRLLFDAADRFPRPRRFTGHRGDGRRFEGLMAVIAREGARGARRLMLRSLEDIDTPLPHRPGVGVGDDHSTGNLPGPGDARTAILGARSVHDRLVIARATIDHLDSLELIHGSPTASAVRTHVVQVLDALLRPGDFVACWAEATLVLGLRDVDPGAVAMLLNQLRQAVAEVPAATPAGRIAITLSFDWTDDDPGVDPLELIRSITPPAVVSRTPALESPGPE